MRLFTLVTALAASMISVASGAQVSPVVQAAGESRLNLAAVLIKALDRNEVCDAHAFPSDINSLVSSATVQLDANRILTWAASVPATSKIKADLAFRQSTSAVKLSGRSVSVAAIEKQLEGTKYHAFGRGVYGSQHNVTLDRAGVANLQDLELLETAPGSKWVASSTTWEVVVVKTTYGEDAKLRIGTTEYSFETKAGEIWLVPTNLPAAEVQDTTLSTSDSYCDV